MQMCFESHRGGEGLNSRAGRMSRVVQSVSCNCSHFFDMADKLTTADRRFSVLALANLFTPDAKLTPCMGALWISQTQRMLAMSKFETQLLKGKGQQRRLTLRNSGMSETSGRSVRIVC